MSEMVIETSKLGMLESMLDCAKVRVERIGRELYIAPEDTEKDPAFDVIDEMWGMFESDGHAVDRFLARKHRMIEAEYE